MRRNHSLVGVALAALTAAATAAESSDQVEAVIPVEVLPQDPSLADGQLHINGIVWTWPAIAQQPARIARAIVVIDERSHRERVLVLAVLGKGSITADGKLPANLSAAQQAWCEYRDGAIPTVECLMDTDGDGKLDVKRQGLRASQSPLSLWRIRGLEQIEPQPYRTAREDELPRYRIGYLNCFPVRTASPALPEEIRFATTFRPDDERLHWPTPSSCNQLARPLNEGPSGARRYQIDRFVVSVAWVGNQLHTNLEQGLPAGTLLGHLSFDRPLLDAAAANDAIAAERPQRPFLFVAGTPSIAAQAAAGDTLYEAEVAHGLTGHLSAPVTNLGLFNRKDVIPQGSAAFGVAMTSTRQIAGQPPSIIWCIPRREEQRWITACVAPMLSSHVMVRSYDPFVVQRLGVSSRSDGATAALVDPGPVDFGAPLKLIVRLHKVDAREIELRWMVDTVADGSANRMRLRRTQDGSAFLMIGGQLLKLTQNAAGKLLVEATGNPDVNVDAVPVDPGRIIESLRGR